MAEVKVYFEDVQENQEIDIFQRKTDFMHWNRYAAVNDEFVYIHMDDEAGKAAGQSGAFAMGNLRFAYLHNMLRHWIGNTGRIKKVSIQYRGFILKNDTCICKGKVTKKYTENGEHLVDLEIGVENQDGASRDRGTATVALPSRGN